MYPLQLAWILPIDRHTPRIDNRPIASQFVTGSFEFSMEFCPS